VFWDALGQAYALGFHKMAIPEQYGGLGLDPQTIGLVWEEIARWGVSFAATLIPAASTPQIILFLAPDNKELIDKYVIPYCEDTRAGLVTAWGSSEPDVGSDGKNYYDTSVHHHTRAVKSGDKYVINGIKSDFVSNGSIAKVYLLLACVDPSKGLRGSGAFVVPRETPGVSTGKPLNKIGLRALNQAAVFFDDAEIPEEYMIFPPGDLYPMLHNSIVTVGNLGVGYLAVGLMRAAYEEALDHAKTRVQWGKPIFEHQQIAINLLRCYQAIESARAFLWKGSWLATKEFPGDLKTSLAAKTFATEQAITHTIEMMHILGAYGISKEYAVEKYCRDAQLLRIMDGTNETLMNKAAALL
jgi:alkylation response protein AidB-like acyl-CoA dehydrogenase